MFTLIDNNKTSIFFIGDIHGEFKAIGNWIKQCGLHNCILIFCGDFGLGFSSVQSEKSDLKKSDKICEERDIDCYIIRGNHDDPSYFDDSSPKLILSRFKTVSDYTVINTPEHNILCLGGAVSVDRIYRKMQYESDIETLMKKRHYSLGHAMKAAKLYWWKNEQFVYNENILNEINLYGIQHDLKIDIVATHSSPNFCQPTSKTMPTLWSELDKELKDDVENERNNFTKVYNYLKAHDNDLKYWFYGHFHKHYFEVIDGTRFTGLDMGRLSKEGGGPGGNFDMAEIRL